MRGDIRMNAVGGGAARNETAAAVILMSPKNSKRIVGAAVFGCLMAVGSLRLFGAKRVCAPRERAHLIIFGQ